MPGERCRCATATHMREWRGEREVPTSRPRRHRRRRLQRPDQRAHHLLVGAGSRGRRVGVAGRHDPVVAARPSRASRVGAARSHEHASWCKAPEGDRRRGSSTFAWPVAGGVGEVVRSEPVDLQALCAACPKRSTTCVSRASSRPSPKRAPPAVDGEGEAFDRRRAVASRTAEPAESEKVDDAEPVERRSGCRGRADGRSPTSGRSSQPPSPQGRVDRRHHHGAAEGAGRGRSRLVPHDDSSK